MKIVAIAAYSGNPPPNLVEEVRKFVRYVATRCGSSITFLVGGYWGLMKYFVDEVLNHGMKVVILPPISREDYDFPSEAIVLRLGVDYRVRSVFLARACDVLVALGGAAGTMQEIFTAYCEGKPIALLVGYGLDSDRLQQFVPCIDERCTSRIETFKNGEELGRWLCSKV